MNTFSIFYWEGGPPRVKFWWGRINAVSTPAIFLRLAQRSWEIKPVKFAETVELKSSAVPGSSLRPKS